MATATSLSSSKFTDITECRICLHTFTEPKGLPCFHTFCLKCIRSHGERQDDERKIPCPVCREEFEVPQGGYEKLKTNFFVADLLDALVTSTEEKKQHCQLCDGNEAIHYCMECDQDLCANCSTNHARSRAAKFHKVISCAEKDNIHIVRPSYCEVHPDQKLELYCRNEECELPICLMCLALDHKQHDIISNKEACDELKLKLQENSSQLNPCTRANNTELTKAKEQTEEFLEQLSTCEKAVLDKSNEIKQTVDSHAIILIDQLQQRQIEVLKAKNIRSEEVARQNLIIESYQKYVEELTSKGSPCDVTREAKQLLERKEKIVASQEEFKQGRLIKEQVTYTPVDVADLASGQNNLIGALMFNDDAQPDVEPTRSELKTSLYRAQNELQQMAATKKKKVPTATLR